MKSRKKVVVLGSTGSIGKQTLEVLGWFPECFEVFGLVANKNIDLLAEQVSVYKPSIVAVSDFQAGSQFKSRLQGSSVECFLGPQGVLELVKHTEYQLAVIAVSGFAGLEPTIAAIEAKKELALANKETLVTGGEFIIEAAKKAGVRIFPVDSEHSAIFQCIQGGKEISRIILTGSGGPFRGYKKDQLANVGPEMALKHPTWQMGPKITIDSATLMNKGLEVIEAKWLFDVDYDQIDVLIHPQSIVHGLVVYPDGAVLAQLGWPDMKIPIQYALLFPERKDNSLRPLDLAAVGELTFERPDLSSFPCLRLACEAGRIGGTMPVVLNAANEVAVAAFLQKRISFLEMPEIISEVMESHVPQKVSGLDDIFAANKEARRLTAEVIRKKH